MKFDDASWHYSGDFPKELPSSAACTHIGMFLAWVLLHELGGDFHVVGCAEDLARLRSRETTPGAYLLQVCDGKLTDEDIAPSAAEFVNSYYVNGYLADYSEEFREDCASIYEVSDSWQTYDRISIFLNSRYSSWSKGER